MAQEDEKEQLVWYAMRATYHREFKAKLLLDEQNVENFIPMHYVSCYQGKHMKRELVPVVRNLIFVRTTPSFIKQLKAGISYLQYMTMVQSGKKVPIIVPDYQMQQFIAVSQTYDEQLLYFNYDELNLSKGTKIRIHGGVLDGQEGIFLKMKGYRNKRIVVLVKGVIAVAMLADSCVVEVIE